MKSKPIFHLISKFSFAISMFSCVGISTAIVIGQTLPKANWIAMGIPGIRIMDTRSGMVKQIVPDGSICKWAFLCFSIWSPDNSKLVYQGEDGLYVAGLFDGNTLQLTYNPTDYHPTWLPDGQHIMFFSGRNMKPSLYLIDVDGQNEKLLIDHINDTFLDASPDGKTIAFVTPDYEIKLLDLETNQVQLLTTDGYAPVWSPDGKQIMFISARDGDTEIYTIESNGNRLRQLTSNTVNDAYHTWSPDGQQIVYVSGELGGIIHTMDADGNNQRPLLRTDGYDGTPIWLSTDQILFSVWRNGLTTWYIVNIDGQSPKPIPLSDAASLSISPF